MQYEDNGDLAGRRSSVAAVVLAVHQCTILSQSVQWYWSDKCDKYSVGVERHNHEPEEATKKSVDVVKSDGAVVLRCTVISANGSHCRTRGARSPPVRFVVNGSAGGGATRLQLPFPCFASFEIYSFHRLRLSDCQVEPHFHFHSLPLIFDFKFPIRLFGQSTSITVIWNLVININ